MKYHLKKEPEMLSFLQVVSIGQADGIFPLKKLSVHLQGFLRLALVDVNAFGWFQIAVENADAGLHLRRLHTITLCKSQSLL